MSSVRSISHSVLTLVVLLTVCGFGAVPNVDDVVEAIADRLEQAQDKMGWNMGSWQFNYPNRRFFDPLAFWHPRKGTFSYADGHAETHEYQDPRTIQYAKARVSLDDAIDQASASSNNVDCDFLAHGLKAR